MKFDLDTATPPLTDGEPAATGLSQTQFATAYHIDVARLRDLEQGRTRPDSAFMAYLTMIEHEPELVKRTLAAEAA